jgi:hypothetical protein
MKKAFPTERYCPKERAEMSAPRNRAGVAGGRGKVEAFMGQNNCKQTSERKKGYG